MDDVPDGADAGQAVQRAQLNGGRSMRVAAVQHLRGATCTQEWLQCAVLFVSPRAGRMQRAACEHARWRGCGTVLTSAHWSSAWHGQCKAGRGFGCVQPVCCRWGGCHTATKRSAQHTGQTGAVPRTPNTRRMQHPDPKKRGRYARQPDARRAPRTDQGFAGFLSILVLLPLSSDRASGIRAGQPPELCGACAGSICRVQGSRAGSPSTQRTQAPSAPKHPAHPARGFLFQCTVCALHGAKGVALERSACGSASGRA